jgi:hypothetical protein
MSPQPTLDARITALIATPLKGMPPPRAVVVTLLLVSIIVLFFAPLGMAEKLTPILGSLGLLIECTYLSHIAARAYRLLLQTRPTPADTVALAAWKKRLRGAVLPAANALFGFWVFALSFYPIAHKVISAAEPGAGIAPLLWILSVGAALVGLSFGQLMALMLDAAQPPAR